MWEQGKKVILKDSTMREGLDVPGVTLAAGQKRALLELLAEARVAEAELVAPGHFDRDLAALGAMGVQEVPIRTSGLVYGYGDSWRDQLSRAAGSLDRLDILMPLAESRPPLGRPEKCRQMSDALQCAADSFGAVGVGFPHATQVAPDYLLEMCDRALQAGAVRLTLYDTNGSADPFGVAELVRGVRAATTVEICFHAHNDLGMATANAVAAVWAGADCLDVTVNGLGDRAGNASLEQVVMALHARAIDHGVRLDLLRALAQAVATMTQVPVPELAPVTGAFAFSHKSPSHLESPALFEAYDPGLIGAARSVCKD